MKKYTSIVLLFLGCFVVQGQTTLTASGDVHTYNVGGGFPEIVDKICGEASNEFLGTTVDLSYDGNIMAVGRGKEPPTAAITNVTVYEKTSNPGFWTKMGLDIPGENTGDSFGQQVSLSDDGTTLAVGAPSSNDNGTNAGTVRVFKYTGGSWVQLGGNIVGSSGDYMGEYCVSLSGDGTTVAMGSSRPTNKYVTIYRLVGGVWVKMGNSVSKTLSEFGRDVSLSNDGNTMACGTRTYDTYKGALFVYEYDGTDWIQVGADMTLIDSQPSSLEYLGTSLELSGDGKRVLGGALTYSITNPSAALGGEGALVVFENDGAGNWVMVGSPVIGELVRDNLGAKVQISDDGTVIASKSRTRNNPNSAYSRFYKYNSVTSDWEKIGEAGNTHRDNSELRSDFSLSGDGNSVVFGSHLENTTINDLVATDDNGVGVQGTPSTPVANVLLNDTYNGSVATTGEVTLSTQGVWAGGFTLNANGSIDMDNTVTSAGSPYLLTYRMTENTKPSNFKDATVTIAVGGVMVATDDNGVGIEGSSTPVVNVLLNDTYNGNVATTTEVTLSTQGVWTGFTLNADGSIDMDNTVTNAGSPYTLRYIITDNYSSSNVDSADVTIIVRPPGTLVATDDSIAGLQGMISDISLVNNDTYNGSSATTAEVIWSEISSTSSLINLDSETGILDIDLRTPKGTYTLTYNMCEVGNQTNCSQGSYVLTIDLGEVNIAGGFTPNGDGINDDYKINGLKEAYPNFEMIIVNRYGDEVYYYKHNGDVTKEPTWWDGKSNVKLRLGGNKKLPIGSYYYVIKFNETGKENKTGWIYLRY